MGCLGVTFTSFKFNPKLEMELLWILAAAGGELFGLMFCSMRESGFGGGGLGWPFRLVSVLESSQAGNPRSLQRGLRAGSAETLGALFRFREVCRGPWPAQLVLVF